MTSLTVPAYLLASGGSEEQDATTKYLRTNMAKTQKQRSAEFRARKRETPEVRGIYAPLDYHYDIKDTMAALAQTYPRAWGKLTIATKRAKEKA
jgi:hypothetical protein